jgi:hypothetical protein
MNRSIFPLGAALLLALLVTGCETDDGGITARTQEKAASYAKLHFWQKNFIAKGVIAESFTPDMVYMAMGHPNRIETKETPGGPAELWTYGRYYPNVDAVHGFQFAQYSAESVYQPQMAGMQTPSAPGNYANNAFGPTVPTGMDRGGGESIGKTAGPQGGSMEPGGLRSYTVMVLFQDGKVARIGASQNYN